MGANAITSLPKMENGDYPTGDQFTFGLGGIPVFATTTTRDAAFGGAGEKVLAQGQLCFIETGNITQYYNGSAWVALVGGLARVGGGSLSGAATTFTGVFSATHNAYLVSLTNVQLSVAGETVTAQLGLAGIPATTNYQIYRIFNNGSAVSASSQTAWEVLISAAAAGQACEFVIMNPALAVASRIKGSFYDLQGARHCIYDGAHSTATAYDDLKIIVGSGTFTGLVDIYGLALS